MYTLGEAAKATGISKAALSKAIKMGRVSAIKGEGGRFQIDPAELHRVYPPVDPITLTGEQSLTALQAKVDTLGELLTQVKSERDDLRQDRDMWREQARLALLTHQSTSPPPVQRIPWRRYTIIIVLELGAIAAGVAAYYWRDTIKTYAKAVVTAQPEPPPAEQPSN